MTIKEKIMKIMSLALEINPPEIKYVREKGPVVFVEWQPHCNLVTVDICSDGWRLGDMPDKHFVSYIAAGCGDSLDSIIAELEKIKADMPGGKI